MKKEDRALPITSNYNQQPTKEEQEQEIQRRRTPRQCPPIQTKQLRNQLRNQTTSRWGRPAKFKIMVRDLEETVKQAV